MNDPVNDLKKFLSRSSVTEVASAVALGAALVMVVSGAVEHLVAPILLRAFGFLNFPYLQLTSFVIDVIKFGGVAAAIWFLFLRTPSVRRDVPPPPGDAKID
jgi:large-conductance mechanosensitive channel